MEASHPQGLSGAEAARRLERLGPPPEPNSRSVASIVAANVFTLFNLIIGVFFILILSLQLWADAIFGVIAALNSYIGIRQELKAKATLDALALLVAPQAQAIRDGRPVDLRADEVVPGDVIRVEPGDQLVADGVAIAARGLTVDESMLTGESDGIRKQANDRMLSGSFVTAGSGYYELDAVREDSHAEQIAGEARTFRHPPSPLQVEVNRVIWATTAVLVPLGAIVLFALNARNTPFEEAAQTATAGLVTLIPEGLVLLMSVTLAVAAVRLAKQNTLVQQMAATEALAAVDTICVDKTGTLTDGELELVAVVAADGSQAAHAERALGRFANSAGERNKTLQVIADRFRSTPEQVVAEVPFSSQWKWSGVTLNGGGGERGADHGSPDAGRSASTGLRSFVMGAPDILVGAGALELPPGLAQALAEHTAAGCRVVAFGESAHSLPSDPASQPPPPLTPRALIVLAERLRPDAAETIEFMRSQEVDLKLISGDAAATVTAVAYAVGVPREAGVIEGPSLPGDRAGLARAAEANTIFCRIAPEQKKALVAALGARGRCTAMIGDGVNDVPALKQARLAVAMGSGSQITKGVADIVLLADQFSMLPRAIGEGRRIARNIHRLGRLYLTKSVYAAVLIGLTSVLGLTFPFLPRHLTVAAFLTLGIPSFVLALAPSEGPLYRGRLLRALASFAVPAGVGIAAGSMLSFFFVDSLAGGTVEEGRTAATTTLIVLGLCFILLLERGPGREHITIQTYMLTMIATLGALLAAVFAIGPVRDFFELELLTAGQWFLSLLAVAAGLLVAAFGWRLPYVQHLEAPEGAMPDDDGVPDPTHRPRTTEVMAVPEQAAVPTRQPTQPHDPPTRILPPDDERKDD